MWKQIIAGILLLGMCGCIKIKDELTINADGSGTVRIEAQSSLPPEFSDGVAGQMMGGAGGSVIYPPVSEGEARTFFPRKDFKVTVQPQTATNGETTTVMVAEFKDINALLASPYGRAHQLSAKITDGSLVVQGVTGMEATARFAEMKDDSGMMGMGMLPGTADLQKKKNEMRSEFAITLPHAISSTTGDKAGTTARWIIERAKCKDADDFAQKLGTALEARCPAEGLKMTPVTPTRLGLLPFAELAGGVAEMGASVDTNKILAAAKFIPYGLSVTRSLDLSGEGGSQQSSAQLTGAVELPPGLEPQKWGEAKLDEAVDAKGNDLKPGNRDENQGFNSRYYDRFSEVGDSGDDESAATNSPRHVITVVFRSPDWKVNEIARIKGSVGLQYFGGSQVVKLTNAVPAAWITDASKGMGGMMGAFNSSEKSLNSDDLARLGLSLSVQMAMTQSALTILSVQVKGRQATLLDAQVFDANGKPWPTIFGQQNFGGNDDGSSQIMVAGRPQPPLSLALVASGSSSTIDVPILLEHVSFSK